MEGSEAATHPICRRIRLTVLHFTAVGHILQRAGLLATVPETLAQSIGEPFDLVHLPHPAELPEAAINLFWHAKVHDDAGIFWLR